MQIGTTSNSLATQQCLRMDESKNIVTADEWTAETLLKEWSLQQKVVLLWKH